MVRKHQDVVKEEPWKVEDALMTLVKEARTVDAELHPPADGENRRYTFDELEQLTRDHFRRSGFADRYPAVHRGTITKYVFESNFLRSFIGKSKGFFGIIGKKRPVIRIALWAAHPLGAAYEYGAFLDRNGRACVRHAHDIVRGVARLLEGEYEIVYRIFDFSRFPPTGQSKTLTQEEFQRACEESSKLRAEFFEVSGVNFDITTLQSQTLSVMKHAQVSVPGADSDWCYRVVCLRDSTS